jgi:hypothetical protein
MTPVSAPRFFVIPVKLYGVDVIVSIAQDDRMLYDSMVDRFPDYNKDSDYLNSDRIGMAFPFENGSCLIRLNDFDGTPFLKGTLAHEIFHVVTFIMGHVGIKLHDASDEAYAYLTSFLTEEIYSILEGF